MTMRTPSIIPAVAIACGIGGTPPVAFAATDVLWLRCSGTTQMEGTDKERTSTAPLTTIMVIDRRNDKVFQYDPKTQTLGERPATFSGERISWEFRDSNAWGTTNEHDEIDRRTLRLTGSSVQHYSNATL